jgi:hypothetical protein
MEGLWQQTTNRLPNRKQAALNEMLQPSCTDGRSNQLMTAQLCTTSGLPW